MGADYGGRSITVIAGATLTGYEHYPVVQESSGKVTLADSAGELTLGVLESGGTITDGRECRVRIGGTALVITGAAVDEGAELSANASGKLVTASAGDYVAGIALEPGSGDGDVIRVKMVCYQKNPAS
jgi:hypothetical protein